MVFVAALDDCKLRRMLTGLDWTETGYQQQPAIDHLLWTVISLALPACLLVLSLPCSSGSWINMSGLSAHSSLLWKYAVC